MAELGTATLEIHADTSDLDAEIGRIQETLRILHQDLDAALTRARASLAAQPD